jgi:transcriptional regulator with XRE-family HTH domain
MEIGKIITKLRKHRGLSQQDLADRIEISIKHMNQLENGAAFPRWEMLMKILEALDGTFHVKAKVLHEIEMTAE